MKQAFVLLLAPALAGCAPASQGGEPASDGGFRSYRLTAGLECAPSLGLLQCLRLHEASAAQRFDVQPSRARGTLCLSAPGAANACFRDRDGLGYAFVGRTAGRFVVVEADELGGYTVLLVDEKDGSQLRVDNRPLFSPDGAFFATVSYDTDAGYLPNRVDIRDASTGVLLHRVDRFAPGTGPVRARWTGPARLSVLYSRAEYSPDTRRNAGNFNVWREEAGTWHDDHAR